ncbi:MAG: CTP synthase [Crenarchaeota archaeon]|nr:CTP synthase [Thermoproteota archaeon]
MKKYIFVTGGVLSSVGKGVITASIAKILQARGYTVTTIKIDPYFNVDAGTMNPYQHGEVFVTADGGETDLDLGHYERFLDVELSKDHNITSGKVFLKVIMDERAGKYLGQTVQLIPHVTDEIKREIRYAVDKSGADIGIVEIGGTVGDYEGLPFLEAIRQMRLEEGFSNTVFVHVALVPIIETTGEPKTKPLQHSVFELRRIGIQPDIIIARCKIWLDDDTKRKIALFTNVPPDAIFTAPYVDTIYRIPLILDEEGLGDYLVSRLGLESRRPEFGEWCSFIENLLNPRDEVSVGLCGKYVKLKDSYLSILEALNHAGARLRVKPRLVWIDAEAIEQGSRDELEKLKDVDSLIVLPGFGTRGAEGKIRVIKEARELGIPFLGICFGMQLAVVEFARNVLGLHDANSTEIDPDTPEPVIDLAPEQKNVDKVGGTMMLGNKPVKIVENTLAHKLYGTDLVYERHRHRYVVNERYIEKLEKAGMKVSGYRADSPYRIVEIVELRDHMFFIGTQFHPEFRSRPLRPHPVFIGLLDAALRFKYSSRSK